MQEAGGTKDKLVAVIHMALGAIWLVTKTTISYAHCSVGGRKLLKMFQ